MRLRTRLVLLVAVAALGPLGVLGLGAISVSTSAVRQQVTDLQGRTADGLALYVNTWLDLQLRLLSQQTRSFRLESLDERSQLQLLRLIYTQLPELTIVSLTDGQGMERVPSVYRPDDGGPEAQALAGREVVGRTRLARARSASPGLGGAALALGQPWTPEGRRGPVLPVRMLASPGYELAVELALDPIAEELARQGGERRDVAVLDASGNLFIAGAGGLVVPGVFRPFLGGAAASDVRYAAADGQQVYASCAPVPGAGWTVVVAEPLSQTAAASRSIQQQTAYVAAVAAVLAMVMGALFARQISGPVVALRDAALAVAEGDLGRRVPPPTSGELGELTRAFNFMSSRLDRNRREIDAKNSEIEAWNVELVARVDARTRELSEAQERLLQSARLAAAGEMGAGLAHELNNPLAGILGLAQVLLFKARAEGDRDMLRGIEEQALRCKEIVARLLELTAAYSEVGIETTARDIVDLDELLAEILTLVGAQLRQRGLEVEHARTAGLLVRGDRAALAQALTQLLGSLRMAATAGGILRVRGARLDGVLEFHFGLVGDEVRVGKDDWMATGLGIWAARQVLAAHRGTLIEPPPGGTPAGAPVVWRLILPEA